MGKVQYSEVWDLDVFFKGGSSSEELRAHLNGLTEKITSLEKTASKFNVPISGEEANDIAKLITDNKRNEWLRVTGNEYQITGQVQALADSGVVVIALREGTTHGHLAIAMPMPPKIKLETFPGHGPMVRDGNVHLSNNGKRKPSGWGAVRASYAFDKYTSPDQSPRWYVWRHSQQMP